MKLLDTLRDYIRPLAVVALLGVLLVGAVLSGVLEAIWPGRGLSFTLGTAGWFDAIPGDYYTLTGAALLGYTAARGVEKVIEKRRPKVDDPDANE